MIKELLQQHVIPFREVAYPSGAYLYQAGESLQKLYFLNHGCICLLSECQDGCLRYITQPRLLSMADLLRTRHVLSALVLEESSVVEIDQEKLLEYVAGNKTLLQACLRLICRDMEDEALQYE